MVSKGIFFLALLSVGVMVCWIHEAHHLFACVSRQVSATIRDADEFSLDRIPNESAKHFRSKTCCAWLDDVEKSPQFPSGCSAFPGYRIISAGTSTSLQTRARNGKANRQHASLGLYGFLSVWLT